MCLHISVGLLATLELPLLEEAGKMGSASLSPFIPLVRASHSVLGANGFISGRDAKGAPLPSPASFLHKVGLGTRGSARLCFQRFFFSPQLLFSHTVVLRIGS